jgi:shikimate kinase
MRFIDIDAEVERISGRTIQEIFDVHGETAFRDLETQVTGDALNGAPAVIASGAGWIAFSRNRALLLSRGRIIYLRVTPETAAKRLGEGHGRPKLAGGATIEMLRRLEAERAVFYELSDRSLDTEGLTLQQVTDKLADLIKVINKEI